MSLGEIARTYRELPLDVIDPPRLASRAQFSEDGLDRLAADIRINGVIQALCVGRTGDRYEVIAGHRRLLASKRAGRVSVPCLIYPSVDAGHEAIKHAENYHREDLNPADEAIYFAEILERDHGGDTDRLAAALNLTRAYVEGRLNLIGGDERIFAQLQAGKIGVGVAQQLNRCTDPEHRLVLLDAAIHGGATVAVASGWIEQWKRWAMPQGPTSDGTAGASTIQHSPPVNYMTCRVCGKTDHPETMRPVQVHGHCDLAILEPMIAAYRGDAA